MASNITAADRYEMPYLRHFIIATTVWTAVAITLVLWERADRQEFITANALSSANATFEKDLAFRRWAAGHGGVYVPVTAETPPNPYLNVPERDIATPSGRQLTLMNPAYMIRQVYEISRNYSGAPQGHITSLKPLRPENTPDSWERRVLELFAGGTGEFSEFQVVDGVTYFRFMRPLTVEKPCLKCHAAQGYHEGDIRGGISVSIPVDELQKKTAQSSARHLIAIALVWLFGVIGLLTGLRRIGNSAQALSESEERYRQQFRQSQAVMLIIDPENCAIVDANPAAASFYGYDGDTLLQMKLADINISQPDELARCVAAVTDGSNKQFIARHRLCDGAITDVEVFSNPVTIKGKTLLHSIVVDISGRQLAERELRDKMDFAENLILNSTTPTFVINANHQVLIWNRALEELTGIKAQELIGTDEQWRAFYPEPRPTLADVVLDGSVEEAHRLYRHIAVSRLIPDGLRAEGDYNFNNRRCRLVFSSAPVRDRSGAMIAAIETLEDITERISLEAQLFQAQKMESVGELAGGIAHDFNNVLTVINGYADLLKMTLPDNDEGQQIAREISASVDRAADMTRSLLAFSGKHEVLLQYDDLNHVLANIRKSLTRLIREDVSLTVTACGERLPVYVDRVQIEQVLINLVVNARDAVGANGRIAVSTTAVQYIEPFLEGFTVIPPGHYACLSVGDNGSGIDDVTMQHIFEPFFTTKEKGKGTGLGLAIVQSIIAKHNGFISVVTAPGTGTVFRCYLPRHSEEAPPEPEKNEPLFSHHGTETVLVIEDDSAIMKLLREVLIRYGYKVLAAGDGVEALEIFNTHCAEISIAIVDVIIPHLNGKDVVEQIRRQRPELPIIMTSGYTDDIIDRTAIDALNVTYKQKPVRPLDLLATIRLCLRTGE